MSMELKLVPMWPEPACSIIVSVLIRHASAKAAARSVGATSSARIRASSEKGTYESTGRRAYRARLAAGAALPTPARRPRQPGRSADRGRCRAEPARSRPRLLGARRRGRARVQGGARALRRARGRRDLLPPEAGARLSRLRPLAHRDRADRHRRRARGRLVLAERGALVLPGASNGWSRSSSPSAGSSRSPRSRSPCSRRRRRRSSGGSRTSTGTASSREAPIWWCSTRPFTMPPSPAAGRGRLRADETGRIGPAPA